MKKIYLGILGLVSFAFGAFATMQERWLQGYQAYEKGAYQEALTKYESIENPGPAVWYNMGNCFFALGNDLDALVCWRRSQKFMDPVLYQKAEQAIRNLRERYSIEQNRGFIDRSITSLLMVSMYGSLLFWQLLTIIFWLFFLLCLPFFVFRKKWVVVIGAVALFIVLGAMLFTKYVAMTQQHALVAAESQLCIAPDERFSQGSHLDRLQEVRILEKKDSWYKISQRNKVGWVKAENLISI
jgi:tetratricopeptide (TPR) repeat protein